MIDVKQWCSVASLDWIEKILQERFGHSFILVNQHNDNRLILKLKDDQRHITLNLDATFTRTDSDLPCSNWNSHSEGWQSVLEPDLPTPGLSKLPIKLIESTYNGFHIHYDILGLTYWMLSRQEEVGGTCLDNHGRFPATSSHAFKHGYLERPVVDEWLYVLGQVILRTWPGINLKKHSFRMQVSHDVDQPSLYAFKSPISVARMMVGHLIKRRDLISFFKAPYIKFSSHSKISQHDPFNTFEWIMDQSDLCGISSAFYFICGGSDPLDAEYKPDDIRIRNLLLRIYERGHEIGLHPSYGSYKSIEMICQEAEILRRICGEEGIKQCEWGGRMHYLRWEHATTLQAFSNARLSYDNTLSYADRPGFRCGTCFEYPAFNPITMRLLPLRIRPLVMMECSLIDDAYLGLGTSQAALDKALALKNTCAKVSGVFSFLWHNSSFTSLAHKQLYVRLLNGE